MLMNLWVKDKADGSIHQVGTDVHDSLQLFDGYVEYYNLQNGCGTLHGNLGEYIFVDEPEMSEFIEVTPDQLKLNRELIHKDIQKILAKNRSIKSNSKQRRFSYERIK
jgi:hypothetical protein